MRLILNKIADPYRMLLEDTSGKKCIMDSGEQEMSPMQLLAGALVGCMSIDVLHILRKQKEDPATYKVEIDAYKNPDVVPSPFEKIHLLFHVDKSVPLKKIERAINLSLDKYCSVRASLDKEIEISYEINQL